MRSLHAIRSEFDRLAGVEGLEVLRHTDHYFPWLLRQLPERVRDAAEVGCGSGALTALLASRADRVVALDLSPRMLDAARARCAPWAHVKFEQRDANAWRPAPRSLDVVVSAGTLHHLQPEVVLPRWKKALRPGGVLAILDVLDRPGVRNLPRNALAIATSGWMRWRRSGRVREDPRVREEWAAHARFDRLLTLAEARRMARTHLSGAVVRHHLLWRYSILWRTEDRG